MAIEEYVPTTTPRRITKLKPRSPEPPKMYITHDDEKDREARDDGSGHGLVDAVVDRSGLSAVAFWRFSRIRSNTTIVSFKRIAQQGQDRGDDRAVDAEIADQQDLPEDRRGEEGGEGHAAQARSRRRGPGSMIAADAESQVAEPQPDVGRRSRPATRRWRSWPAFWPQNPRTDRSGSRGRARSRRCVACWTAGLLIVDEPVPFVLGQLAEPRFGLRAGEGERRDRLIGRQRLEIGPEDLIGIPSQVLGIRAGTANPSSADRSPPALSVGRG